MRRMLVLVAAVGLLTGTVPAGAVPGTGLEPVGDALSRVGPGYVATDNVEWVGTVPINADSAGSVIRDDRLYITDDRGLTIYDISEPTAPERLGFTLVPQSPYIVEEDPETNGEILLISSYTDSTRGLPGPLSVLYVVDVSDPTDPYVRSQVQGAQQHTWSCVLDCTWGYGNVGVIADLRDVDAPVRSSANWWTRTREQLAALDIPVETSPHDVTEVAPGFVVVSSNPVVLLDVREDPEDPKVIAVGELDDGRFIHTATSGRTGGPTASCSSAARPSGTAPTSAPARS
jgi:hypothetical protein